MMNPRTISGRSTSRTDASTRAALLLELASDRLAREMDRYAATFGLTDAKLLLLQTLECCTDGCAGLCSIGDSLGVSRPNVTKLVDGLERAGLVTRTPHPTDRRRVQARLTPEGARVARAAGPGREERRVDLWDDLTDEQLATLSTLLERVARRPAGSGRCAEPAGETEA